MTTDIADISTATDATDSAKKWDGRRRPPGKTPGQPPDNPPAPGRRTVTIHAGAESDGASAVKIGVNGEIILVPRNTPCDLPEEYIEVLRNAVIIEWRDMDGEMKPFERQRYSFTISN